MSASANQERELLASAVKRCREWLCDNCTGEPPRMEVALLATLAEAVGSAGQATEPADNLVRAGDLYRLYEYGISIPDRASPPVEVGVTVEAREKLIARLRGCLPMFNERETVWCCVEGFDLRMAIDLLAALNLKRPA